MQMLSQGGMDTGEHPECVWPSFEDPRATAEPSGAWMSEYDGKALKVLMPGDYPPNDELTYQAIWLDRDAKEQAKSWVKIQKARFGTSGDVPTITRRIRRDRRRHVDALRKVTRQLLFLRFEGLLREPELWSRRIAAFVGEDLDIQRMADVVIPRKSWCAQGIMENTLAKIGPPEIST